MPNLNDLRGVTGHVEVVFDSTGKVIAPDSWPNTINYNGDGTINYIDVTDGTSVWRQTYTYTNGKLTGIGAWIKQ